MPAAPPHGSDFSPAQLEAVIEKIEKGLESVVNAANSFIQHTESTTGSIPAIGNDVKAMLDRFRSLVQEFVKKVAEFIAESHVPIIMWEYGNTWGAQGVAGQLGQISVELYKQDSGDWQGHAGQKYKAATHGQQPAAAAVQNKANTIAGACYAVAGAGVGFYVAVAGLVAGVIMACCTGPGGLVMALVSLAGAVASLLYANAAQARAFQSAGEPVAELDGPGDGWPDAILPLPQVGS